MQIEVDNIGCCPKCGDKVDTKGEHFEIETYRGIVSVKIKFHPACWYDATGEERNGLVNKVDKQMN
jgi:hypothetical protein